MNDSLPSAQDLIAVWSRTLEAMRERKNFGEDPIPGQQQSRAFELRLERDGKHPFLGL